MTPMPALPATITVVAAPAAAVASASAIRASSGFTPDEAAADHSARHRCIVGRRARPRGRRPTPASRPADPLRCPGAAPSPAPPVERAQRAHRRGVALLHEVGVDDGLPVRARPRPAQGPRREQAAAADGPAHRVLHEDRRAGRWTRSRASAGRCSARRSRTGPRRAIGIELDPRWAAVSTGRRSRRSGPSATAPDRVSSTSDPRIPGGERRLRPVGAGAAPRRRAGAPPGDRDRTPSTSSRRTRPTTSSSR